MVLIYLKLIQADCSGALTAAQTAYLATEGAPSVNRPLTSRLPLRMGPKNYSDIPKIEQS
jgi:hypothetical protein